jgi:hypothetical protein
MVSQPVPCRRTWDIGGVGTLGVICQGGALQKTLSAEHGNWVAFLSPGVGRLAVIDHIVSRSSDKGVGRHGTPPPIRALRET